ncbi:MAG: anti-sigma factor antagonist [Planctomycetota bacterium]
MARLELDITETAINETEKAVITRIIGAVDGTTNTEFESKLAGILKSGVKYLILNLSGVTYINSSGMGALIKFTDSYRSIGGEIALVSIPKKVVALFDMLGLISIFRIFDIDERALGYLRKFIEEKNIKSKVKAPEVKKAAPEVERRDEPGKYPVLFGCPACETRVEIPVSGKYKCPRCATYFSAGPDGKVKALRLEESKVTELRLPCASTFADGLRRVIDGLADELGFPSGSKDAIYRSMDEAWSLAIRSADRESDMVHVLMVANARQFIAGLICPGTPFTDDHDPEQAMGFQIIQKSMDRVEVANLPAGGQLLKMVKVLGAPAK